MSIRSARHHHRGVRSPLSAERPVSRCPGCVRPLPRRRNRLAPSRRVATIARRYRLASRYVPPRRVPGLSRWRRPHRQRVRGGTVPGTAGPRRTGDPRGRLRSGTTVGPVLPRTADPPDPGRTKGRGRHLRDGESPGRCRRRLPHRRRSVLPPADPDRREEQKEGLP